MVRNLCDCPRVLVLVRYARACIVICCASILGHILGLYIADTSRFNESADWNSFVLACIGGHSALECNVITKYLTFSFFFEIMTFKVLILNKTTMLCLNLKSVKLAN